MNSILKYLILFCLKRQLYLNFFLDLIRQMKKNKQINKGNFGLVVYFETIKNQLDFSFNFQILQNKVKLVKRKKQCWYK